MYSEETGLYILSAYLHWQMKLTMMCHNFQLVQLIVFLTIGYYINFASGQGKNLLNLFYLFNLLFIFHWNAMKLAKKLLDCCHLENMYLDVSFGPLNFIWHLLQCRFRIVEYHFDVLSRFPWCQIKIAHIKTHISRSIDIICIL